MPALSCSPRETIRGKWFYLGGVGLVFLGALTLFACFIFQIELSLDDFRMEIHFLPFEMLENCTLFEMLGTLISIPFTILFQKELLALVCCIVLPLVPLMIYLLEGHKLRYGAWMLSASMALVSLFSVYTQTATSYTWLQECENLPDLLEYAFTHPEFLLSGFLFWLSFGLCLAAAVIFPLVPKVGRYIAAGCLATNAFLPFLILFISSLPMLNDMLIEEEILNTSMLYLLFVFPTLVAGICGMLTVLLLTERIDTAASAKPTASTSSAPATPATPAAPAETKILSAHDADVMALYKLRMSGEISAEEYRHLRDMLNAE